MKMEDVTLSASGGGTRLKVRARAGARRSAIEGEHAGALKVSVTEAPERGRANDAIARVLAEALRVAPSAVRILAGRASRDKIVEIASLRPDEVRRRLSGGDAPSPGSAP